MKGIMLESMLEDCLSEQGLRIEQALADHRLSQFLISLHFPPERILSGARWKSILENAFPNLYGRKILKIQIFGGQPMTMVRNQGASVNAITVSPDSRWIATGCWKQTVVLWRNRSGLGEATFAWRGDSSSPQSLAFSPDGGRLAYPASGRTAIAIRNTTSSDLLATLRMNEAAIDDLTVWNSRCMCVWSPDSSRLVAVHRTAGEMSRSFAYVWDAETYAALRTVANGEPTPPIQLLPGLTVLPPIAVYYSSDGLRLLGAKYTQQEWSSPSALCPMEVKIDVWDVVTGVSHRPPKNGAVEGPARSLVCCAAALDSQATQCAVWVFGDTIHLFDLTQGGLQWATLRHASRMDTHDQHLMFCSTGQRLLSWHTRRPTPDLPFIQSHGTSLKLWDTRSGEDATSGSSRFNGLSMNHVCFSPDGQHFVTASADGPLVDVWKASDGSWSTSYSIPQPAHDFDYPEQITFSADGTRLWVGTFRGHIYSFPLQ
ncbi:hypothetical protein BD311DRAFT_94552 [Dichomitus squalens]|uniref:Uncharacterized protein n=1 Tax=Dichomitus squalens TaxID=114155 RepID=A0A4Q9MB93_9APHY|nr:hypothetical protein BD311DRAFT_94552 [Dichomitus squalens]